MKTIMTIFLAVTGLAAQAMPIKAEILRPRYAREGEVTLDLKSKTLSFNRAEFDQCGQNMVRRAQTLTFSCTLPIPNNTRVSKLQGITSAKSKEIAFGGTKRTVMIEVGADARSVTMSTAFDATGIDFELSKFNDDFFAVYAKVAQLVITDALKAAPVKIDVLESR
jgi:hypothetical protein